MGQAISESRIKLALRVLHTISVARRFPDPPDAEALRSFSTAHAAMPLDELACDVIVEEVQKMRLAAERQSAEALKDRAREALDPCA